MADFYFIVNPIAGNGTSLKSFEKMERLLAEQSVEYAAVHSEYAGHAIELAAQAVGKGYKCIVAVGGDGTAREVAQALCGTDMPMCILPCGTGNDVVRALRIPSDPAEVLAMLLNTPPRAVDAATANGAFYLNVAGFGFDVDVLLNTERYKKYFRGMTGYLLGLLRALFGLKLTKIHVVTDEGEFDANALICAAANGTHFGGGMNVTPEADMTDGRLDICIIRDVTRGTALRVLTKFLKGKHTKLEITNYFKAKKITIMSELPVPVQLDGEIIGETPVTFEIQPKALQMIMG